jgi:hypothetical protein
MKKRGEQGDCFSVSIGTQIDAPSESSALPDENLDAQFFQALIEWDALSPRRGALI